MSEREPRSLPLPEESELDRFVSKEEHFEKRDLPSMESLPAEFREVVEQLPEISGFWNPVEIYTADPESITAEKLKVFQAFERGEQYNPQFSYERAQKVNAAESRVRLEALQAKVREVSVESRDHRLVKVALDRKIKDDLATTDIIEGIQTGNDAITARGFRAKYPGTDGKLMQLAQERYNALCRGEQTTTVEGVLKPEEIRWLKDTQFDAEQIKSAFETVLQQYGIFRKTSAEVGFQVVVDERATAIDVRDKSEQGPTIFIPADRQVDGTTLLVLIDHEIGGHARQSMNGERLFKIGGGSLKVDDETLYEGLAMRNERSTQEKLFGEVGAMPTPLYAFAVQAAEEGKSFAEIFEDQVERRLHIDLKIDPAQPLPEKGDIPPESQNWAMRAAWATTYRIMRGHVDTTNSEKFAMAKDLAYLRGFMIQQELDSRDLGHINESAVIAKGGLAMLAEYKLRPEDLPIQYELEDPALGPISPAHAYFKNVLQPRITE